MSGKIRQAFKQVTLYQSKSVKRQKIQFEDYSNNCLAYFKSSVIVSLFEWLFNPYISPEQSEINLKLVI